MSTQQRNVTVNAVTAEVIGARAFRTFCTPRLASCRSAHHDQLAERARFHLRPARARRLLTRVGEIQTYVFEPRGRRAASVLLVHGWTGEAAFMAAFADYMCRHGVRSVLLDLPAHGQSAGRHTNLMDCARAVHEAASA